MKTVSMSGSRRENVGKKDAKQLRREEKVPCVLYGGEKQIQFSVPEKSFKPLIFTPEVHYVDLNIDGETKSAVLQDIQYHPVTDSILHADFLELHQDKHIVMSVPVLTKGVSPGVLKGGKLVVKIRRMRVKALPKHMPENITIDISNLDIAQGVKVSQIPCENMEILEVKTSEAVLVKPTRASTK